MEIELRLMFPKRRRIAVFGETIKLVISAKYMNSVMKMLPFKNEKTSPSHLPLSFG